MKHAAGICSGAGAANASSGSSWYAEPHLALQQALKAVQQLEGGCQRCAVVKRLHNDGTQAALQLLDEGLEGKEVLIELLGGHVHHIVLHLQHHTRDEACQWSMPMPWSAAVSTRVDGRLNRQAA
jgi:hypothetical protein